MSYDYSSNNNVVWLFRRSFWVLLGFFYYDGLIGILLLFFGQPFWTGILDFRLQILEIRLKSPLSFCTFKYTYICFSNENTFRGPQSTHWLVSLSAECHITVCDAGSTLKQHWMYSTTQFGHRGIKTSENWSKLNIFGQSPNIIIIFAQIYSFLPSSLNLLFCSGFVF